MQRDIWLARKCIPVAESVGISPPQGHKQIRVRLNGIATILGNTNPRESVLGRVDRQS